MIYYFFYSRLMKLAHRFNWHYAPPSYPEGDMMLWCHWCGFRQVTEYHRSRELATLSGTGESATKKSTYLDLDKYQ